MSWSIDSARSRRPDTGRLASRIQALGAWCRSLTPVERGVFAVLAVVSIAVVVWWVGVDHSRPLTDAEVRTVLEWVGATQSDQVRYEFERLYSDGVLTTAELGTLAEMAKGSPVPQGLYQPVVID